MKKILKLVGVALCLVAFTQNSNAQFSAGADLVLPMGDWGKSASMGFGASVGYDHAIGDNMSIGGQAGFTMFGGKEPDNLADGDEFSSSYILIPILANFKYYFTDNTNGAYGIASLGMTSYKYKSEHTYDTYEFSGGTLKEVRETDEFDFSGTYLTYGVGAGYLINEKIDLSARYLIISSEGASSAGFNIRAAYKF